MGSPLARTMVPYLFLSLLSQSIGTFATSSTHRAIIPSRISSPSLRTSTFQASSAKLFKGKALRACGNKCRELREDVKDDIAKLREEITNAAAMEENRESLQFKEVKDPLPPSSKGEIFRACFLVSGLVTSLGVALRQYAAKKLSISGADPDFITSLTSNLPKDVFHLDAKELGIMVGIGAAVTLLRQVTLASWEDYQWATDRSNEQVLRPLSSFDLLWVAALPGVSEELLFRGALIPAVYPDWRGAVIAALTFGVLHNSGGRNLASATFATVAGAAYGAAFLATSNVLVPMGAHTISNLASALIWRQAHPIATAYVPEVKPEDSEAASDVTAKSKKESAPKEKRKRKQKKANQGFGA